MHVHACGGGGDCGTRGGSVLLLLVVVLWQNEVPHVVEAADEDLARISVSHCRRSRNVPPTGNVK